MNEYTTSTQSTFASVWGWHGNITTDMAYRPGRTLSVQTREQELNKALLLVMKKALIKKRWTMYWEARSVKRRA